MLIFNGDKNIFSAFKTLKRLGYCSIRSTCNKGLVIIEKDTKYYNQYAVYINGIFIYCFDNIKSALKQAINSARKVGIY